MKLLFALLLIGATAPVQAHWYQKLKALQEAAAQFYLAQHDAETAVQNPGHF